MIVWFAALAVGGVVSILDAPQILAAVNPEHAIFFLTDHGFSSFRRGVNYNTWLAANGYLWLKGQTDTNPANNSATDTDTLTPQADLSITKTDSPDPVAPSQPLVYTISVSNAGPAAATSVVVAESLPPGTAFLSATVEGA